MTAKRWITPLAIGALLVVPATWLMRDARGRQVALPAGSAHDVTAEGASLARAYLEARAEKLRAPPVRVLETSLAQAELEADAVLFRIEPHGPAILEWLQERMDEAEREARKREKARREREAREEDEAEGDAETSPDGDAGEGATDGADDEDPERDAVRRGLDLDDAELQFVQRGGRMVVGISRDVGAVGVLETDDGAIRRVHPSLAGVERLLPPVPRVLDGPGLRQAHALFAQGNRPVVAQLPLGRGEIVVLACPEALENASIAHGDHLALLETLAGDGRPVWFDEFVHGVETEHGVMALLREARLGPFVLFGAVALLGSAWRRAVRVGPPEDPHRERRSEAVDFVDSVARLYETSLRRRDALVLYRRALVQEIALREGVGKERAEQRAEELTRGLALAERVKHDVDGREFERILSRLNEAHRRLHGGTRRRTRRVAR